MDVHATHTRRSVIGSALTCLIGLAAGTCVVGRRTTALSGAVASISAQGAQAGPALAERWRLDRTLEFPVDPTGGLVVLDNFGGYSASAGPCGHRGIDISRSDYTPGQPLVACTDGVLVGQRTDPRMAMGNAWILRDVEGTSYRYHHLEAFTPGLAVGSFVRKGQVIGTMGSTGNAGAAAHLHFEIRLGGTDPVDPLPLLPVPDGVRVVAQSRC